MICELERMWKRSWPRYSPGICLEGLRRATKENLTHDSRSTGQDLNLDLQALKQSFCDVQWQVQ
jgi:hypothetical protein